MLFNIQKGLSNKFIKSRPRLMGYIAESLTDLFILNSMKTRKGLPIGVASYIESSKYSPKQRLESIFIYFHIRNCIFNTLFYLRSIFIKK